jgi:hypothetical protein
MRVVPPLFSKPRIALAVGCTRKPLELPLSIWGGASIHGQGSALQDYMVQLNLNTLDWGSSIYPGMDEAEWIRYQPDDGSTKTLEFQEFESAASQSMKTWDDVMEECIGESSSTDNQDPFHACL